MLVWYGGCLADCIDSVVRSKAIKKAAQWTAYPYFNG
tara:strand:+ start:63 stop:173 length:111 start_codon:yes stop_codon:yes gene_type:complete